MWPEAVDVCPPAKKGLKAYQLNRADLFVAPRRPSIWRIRRHFVNKLQNLQTMERSEPGIDEGSLRAISASHDPEFDTLSSISSDTSGDVPQSPSTLVKVHDKDAV